MSTIETDDRTLVVLDEQMMEVHKIRGNFQTFHKVVRPSKEYDGVQNVFDRTISLNSHYMMLFKNTSDEGEMNPSSLTH